MVIASVPDSCFGIITAQSDLLTQENPDNP